jgi:hypothetical protein
MVNRNLYKLVFLFFLLLSAQHTFSSNYGDGERDNPVIIIHDTVVAPGELLLQMDALHFVGDNGQISAISLKIDVDTNLIEFINIQNTTLVGSWLANYNYNQDEITIIYTAYSGNGFDIDGKLLDLHIFYSGGFDDSLHFKDGCEVSNVYLQTIQNIEYYDGMVTQVAEEGVISQDSVAVNYGDTFAMPVLAQGVGFDSVNELLLRVGFDSNLLQYQGITEAAISGIEVIDTNEVVTYSWQDTVGFADFSSQDTLFYMNFVFMGDTVASTTLLPGSKVFNNGSIVPSQFFNGEVIGRYWLEVLSSPDTAGSVTGGGFYLAGDTVTVTAIPEIGYHFGDWLYGDSIVSYDSVFTFVKSPGEDTMVSEFKANTYNLLLFVVPADGGTVTGDGDYQYGDSVTVIASPNTGYDFVAWLFGDDTVSFDSSYTFVMPHNNLGLTAAFQIQTFSITVSPNNPDYGNVSGGGMFNYGDSANLIATPNPYYNFIVWTEDGQPVSYDSVYTFFVDQDRELIANFQYDAACSAPVGLFADSLSDSTAMLHWLPSGEESEWDLIWGSIGFDTASAGILVESLQDTSYYLENLTAGSTYDFYVRAVCTDEIHSVWAGPYTFTTWYVGVEENSLINSLVVFPNPANDVINISFEKWVENTLIQYEIVNVNGQKVITSGTKGLTKSTIDIGKLPVGFYFLKIYMNDKTASRVFIKR